MGGAKPAHPPPPPVPPSTEPHLFLPGSCGIITDAGPGSLSTVCCAGLQGRYVTVTIPGREEQLALCEVEVYSVVPEL